jgi:hypothetical protein
MLRRQDGDKKEKNKKLTTRQSFAESRPSFSVVFAAEVGSDRSKAR